MKQNTEPELEIIIFIVIIIDGLRCHDAIQPLYNGFISYICCAFDGRKHSEKSS